MVKQVVKNIVILEMYFGVKILRARTCRDSAKTQSMLFYNHSVAELTHPIGQLFVCWIGTILALTDFGKVIFKAVALLYHNSYCGALLQ